MIKTPNHISSFFPVLWSLGVLIAQHFTIYYGHYFGNVGFASDFLPAQAVPFYWITCIQQGIFPQWIPYEAMGYPFIMDTVSGLFYVPLWVFVILGKTYTHHAAVIFQCLHIFLGAVGMYYFCRRLNLAWVYALAAAMAYQAFGGFYYTAGHDIIVRSYAILPWLLAGFCLHCSWRVRVFLIPLSIYLIFTGGYPGTTMATLFIAGFFVLCQFFLEKDASKNVRKFFVLKCSGLLVLGLACSSIYLLPIWLNRSEIARVDEFATQKVHFFGYLDYFTLFMSSHSDKLGHMMISMRSLFITLPIFAMLFFLKKEDIHKHLPLFLIGVYAALMATGGFFHTVVTKLIPPLAFSRFPCSDYRAFIAIPLIVFGVIGLSHFLERRFSVKEILARSVFLFSTILLGWKSLDLPKGDDIFFWVSVLMLTGFMASVLQSNANKKLLLSLFLILVAVTGSLANSEETGLWRLDNYSKYYRDNFNETTDSSGEVYVFDTQMNNAASLKKRLKENAEFRPARRMPLDKDQFIEWAYMFAWRGYLTGDYMLVDYSNGMQLWRQKRAFWDPVVNQYMMKPTNPMIYEFDAKLESLDDLKHLLLRGGSEDGVVSKSYTSQEVVYSINLKTPSLLLENEMYFPGWKAEISGASKAPMLLKAEAAGGILRAWRLPEGQYDIRLHFDMPFLRLGALVSLVAVFIWIGLIGFSLNRQWV